MYQDDFDDNNESINVPYFPNKVTQIDPILFIDIDEDGRFLISKKAVQYLQQIQNEISIVSIVGPYRTGKSFLLNRFAGVQRGFELGNSTNPCTKGIWIWGITQNEGQTILLLDTEGLNSYERDQNADARLLVLSCLISSTLIYNLMQVIDERSLETLSFTTNISRYLLGTDYFITQYLPNIIWVVRDFSLDLQGKDPNYYLENCLKLIDGDGDEIVQKNQIRIAIGKYFKNRDCFTLVRPTNDEKLLRDIDKLNYQDLRPQFREQLENLIQFVKLNTKCKVFKGYSLNGKRLVDVISQFVQTINNNQVPNIENTWDRIIEKEYNKLIDILKIQGINIELPISYENLIQHFNQMFQQSVQTVQKFNISFDKKLDAFQLIIQINSEKQNDLISENINKSRKFNQLITKKMYEVMNQASNQPQFQNISLLIGKLENLKKIYYQEAKQPTAHENYIQFLELVFQIFEKVNNHNILQKQDTEQQLQQQIHNLNGQLETMTNLLKDDKGKLHKTIEDLKNKFQSERNIYEKKIFELKQQLEDQGYQAQKGELFQDPDNFIKKEFQKEKQQQLQFVKENILDIQEKIGQLTENQEKLYNIRLNLEEQQIRKQIEQQVETEQRYVQEKIKFNYEREIAQYKEELKEYQLQIKDHEKQYMQYQHEIKVLKDKILHMEQQKTKDIEHADQMQHQEELKNNDQYIMWRKLFTKQIQVCRAHDQIKYPNIFALEECESCEKSLCYMCGNSHVENGCQVRNHEIARITPSTDDTINQFNYGALTSLDLNKLKCNCGKDADAKTALCAACGSASCSTECHNINPCTFSQNFSKDTGFSFRSIIIGNAYKMFDKKFTVGTIFSRNSMHFITAYLSDKKNQFFIQRGHRQYGNPHTNTLQALTINQAVLDKEVYLFRVCQCNCKFCLEANYHSVFQCQNHCRSVQAYEIRSYQQENLEESQQICQCKCQACSSGVTLHQHTKIDCFSICKSK